MSCECLVELRYDDLHSLPTLIPSTSAAIIISIGAALLPLLSPQPPLLHPNPRPTSTPQALSQSHSGCDGSSLSLCRTRPRSHKSSS